MLKAGCLKLKRPAVAVRRYAGFMPSVGEGPTIGEPIQPPKTKRWIGWGLGAVILPVAMMSLAIVVAKSNESAAFSLAWTGAILLGLTATWQLPFSLWGKILACLLWAMTMLPILFSVAVMGVCGKFNACL